MPRIPLVVFQIFLCLSIQTFHHDRSRQEFLWVYPVKVRTAFSHLWVCAFGQICEAWAVISRTPFPPRAFLLSSDILMTRTLDLSVAAPRVCKPLLVFPGCFLCFFFFLYWVNSPDPSSSALTWCCYVHDCGDRPTLFFPINLFFSSMSFIWLICTVSVFMAKMFNFFPFVSRECIIDH